MADDTSTSENEETEVEETEETETEGTETDEWTPPTREEWDKLQKSNTDLGDKLKRANNESAKRRQAIKELEKKNETDAERAAREAEEQAAQKWKPRAISALAKSTLVESGARADRVGALSKLLDFTAVDLDGDTVTGLDDQIDSLRTEYPEFFTQQTTTAPVAPKPPKVNRANGTPAGDDKSEDAGSAIAGLFLGK